MVLGALGVAGAEGVGGVKVGAEEPPDSGLTGALIRGGVGVPGLPGVPGIPDVGLSGTLVDGPRGADAVGGGGASVLRGASV